MRNIYKIWISLSRHPVAFKFSKLSSYVKILIHISFVPPYSINGMLQNYGITEKANAQFISKVRLATLITVFHQKSKQHVKRVVIFIHFHFKLHIAQKKMNARACGYPRELACWISIMLKSLNFLASSMISNRWKCYYNFIAINLVGSCWKIFKPDEEY